MQEDDVLALLKQSNYPSLAKQCQGSPKRVTTILDFQRGANHRRWVNLERNMNSDSKQEM